jgi:hypothetical protein
LHDAGYLTRTYTNDKGRKDRNVYFITDKAISELHSRDQSTRVRRARVLKLSGFKMIERIELAKLCLSLQQVGWQYTGTQDTKIDFSLSPNSRVQGTLTSPHGEKILIYQIGRNILDKTANRLIGELSSLTSDSVILYKANDSTERTPAFQKLQEAIIERQGFHNLCMLPFVEQETATHKVSLPLVMLRYGTDKALASYLQVSYGNVKNITNPYQFGNYSIELEGEEYLICNYLLRDHISLELLSKYLTVTEYRIKRQKAIIFTWNGYIKEVQEALDRHQPGRDFIEIAPLTLREIQQAV